MRTLPSGTITFLFTDIEGSTARWEHDPQLMRSEVERHDGIVQATIVAHAGVTFKTVGDAFYAGFGSPADAVTAALAIQRAFAEPGSLRLRIALHTGTAEARDGDYFGPTLNRVARLIAAGHGGQILLSAATQELVRDTLPAGAALLDRGLHRLKDLIRPERIYQLAAADLRSDFPPLSTLERQPHNLPLLRTALLGRERELAELAVALRRPDRALLTLTGVGGTGKTRLAVQLAAELVEEFADGVWFVDLAALRDPDLVPATIAQVLGLTTTGEQSSQAVLHGYLRTKHALLILDNFEQILNAAPIVAELLAVAPRLKVLVTSRAPLHLQAEAEFPVPPLALPETRAAQPTAVLSQYAAVALFIQRAQQARPAFHATDANAPAIAEICARLDGLPLAIELAAARVRLLSPETLLRRLERALDVLGDGARDLPARQQTLRAAIDWSYQLLEPAAQRLLGQLAVFRGGWTIEAAEAVCTGADPGLLDELTALVEQSLVRQSEQPDGEPRFAMLETIREYAGDRLTASGEAEAVRERHATYFAAFAERAAPELERADAIRWAAILDAEIDNLRGALERSSSAPERAPLAARLAIALQPYWNRSHVREGLAWLRRIEPQVTDRDQRAWLLCGLGRLEFSLMIPAPARQHYEQATALFEQTGNRAGLVPALIGLGNMVRLDGDGDSESYYRAALAHAEALGDVLGQSRALYWLGNLAWDTDHHLARTYYAQALPLAQSVGAIVDMVFPTSNAGVIALEEGDYATAKPLLEAGAALARRIGHERALASIQNSLSTIATIRGDYPLALAGYQEALRLSMRLGLTANSAGYMINICDIHIRHNRPRASLRLLGAIGRYFDQSEEQLEPESAPTFTANIAESRELLPAAEADAAWEAGRALTLDQAIAEALGPYDATAEPTSYSR